MQDELKKFLRFLKSIELFQESGQKLSCREEDQRASNRLYKKVFGPSVSDPEGSRLCFSKTLTFCFFRTGRISIKKPHPFADAVLHAH